ncbi:unnamed protein product [Macrosiphum euphorbiae]|uniref:SWIM-type domain-containing protein n=1 Tax=Macrosiphum euphorbiae TaxID=13131 RepID=A0AAV0Y9F7_9HEMI|nr:unnamed protein product [Macrosiphum euphorbiae]
MSSSSSLMCNICKKVFGYHRNLVAHRKKCGSGIVEENINKKSIKCPDNKCGQLFSGYALLRKHVEEYHKIVLTKEHIYFKTLNDFKEWKQKVEKENVCSYVTKSTANIKNAKRTYYHCHRSGYFSSKSRGIKRIKSQGSNKIGSTCTSSMVVTEDANGINVDYSSTHFGHGSNLGRCRLTADERSMIAGKISEGVSFSKILDDIRNNVQSIYDVTTVISKRDLRNVERDFNLVEAKNKYCSKEDKIMMSHNAAVKICDAKIERMSPTTWKIISTTEKESSYDVSKVQEICVLSNCKLKCRLCNICNHIYTCGCPDFMIRSNICKHIHLILLSEEHSVQTFFTQPDESTEQFDNFEKLLVNQDITEPVEKEKKSIINKLMIGVGLMNSNDYSMDDCTDIQKKVDSLLNTIQRKKRKLIDTNNIEPSNKKIDKQLRLVTKKTNCKSQLQNITTEREKIEIKQSFKNTPAVGAERKILHIHNTNDHTY